MACSGNKKALTKFSTDSELVEMLGIYLKLGNRNADAAEANDGVEGGNDELAIATLKLG